ncbi:hypothetical protein [Solidesulfovibrio sp.]
MALWLAVWCALARCVTFGPTVVEKALWWALWRSVWRFSNLRIV